jgi:alkylation response protein AidB-like acyl-CoA dehydrogenase
MKFTLNDEQRMLADTLRRFVEAEYEFEARRKRLSEAVGYSQALWEQLAEMGLFALNVPPEHGGVGGGPVETLIVMEQLGSGLVLEPYLATGVVAPRLLARFGSHGQQARWLPGIADGSLRFALAAGEPQARFDLNDIRTTAERSGDGFVLRGAKSVVLHGDSADWLIVPARTSGGQRSIDGITVFVIDATAPGVHRQGYPSIDHQRVAEVLLDGVRVDADSVIGRVDHGYPVIEWGVDQALAALAAEAVGAMDRLVDLTCEHLRTRVQFGQAIGSFQALSHRAADMRMAVEQARALALMAAATADSEDRTERRRGASAAKAMAGRSGRYVGQQATQLHGGMGMTDELACGHYFKRLTAIDMTLGNSEHHVEMYGEFL